MPMPVHLLTMRLVPLKQSTTATREAKIQAQEVGGIRFIRFIHGDAFCG